MHLAQIYLKIKNKIQSNALLSTRSNRTPSRPLQNRQIQRQPLPQPRRPLRVISQLLPFRGGIRMQQRTERAPIDDQPRHKGPELRRRQQIHLEHGDRVRPHRPVKEAVDSEFGD